MPLSAALKVENSNHFKAGFFLSEMQIFYNHDEYFFLLKKNIEFIQENNSNNLNAGSKEILKLVNNMNKEIFLNSYNKICKQYLDSLSSSRERIYFIYGAQISNMASIIASKISYKELFPFWSSLNEYLLLDDEKTQPLFRTALDEITKKEIDATKLNKVLIDILNTYMVNSKLTLIGI